MVELQGNDDGNKLLTSLKRREEETLKKERRTFGELPSSIAHSLVPPHKNVSVSLFFFLSFSDWRMKSTSALPIDFDTIRSIKLRQSAPTPHCSGTKCRRSKNFNLSLGPSVGG